MLRGFGFVYDVTTGTKRFWYIDKDGIKRWNDNDKPVTEQLETTK